MLSNCPRLAIALISASLVVAACSPGAVQPPSPGPSAAAGPAHATASPEPIAKVLGSTPVPGNPGGLLDAFGSIWVAVRHAGNVSRIDPTTGAVSAQIQVSGEPAYLVSDGNAVWVVEFSDRALARIDPATNAVTTVALPGDAGGGPGRPRRIVRSRARPGCLPASQ
jgi:streptogramin lyase